jgi:hypothetical protein
VISKAEGDAASESDRIFAAVIRNVDRAGTGRRYGQPEFPALRAQSADVEAQPHVLRKIVFDAAAVDQAQAALMDQRVDGRNSAGYRGGIQLRRGVIKGIPRTYRDERPELRLARLKVKHRICGYHKVVAVGCDGLRQPKGNHRQVVACDGEAFLNTDISPEVFRDAESAGDATIETVVTRCVPVIDKEMLVPEEQVDFIGGGRVRGGALRSRRGLSQCGSCGGKYKRNGRDQSAFSS